MLPFELCPKNDQLVCISAVFQSAPDTTAGVLQTFSSNKWSTDRIYTQLISIIATQIAWKMVTFCLWSAGNYWRHSCYWHLKGFPIWYLMAVWCVTIMLAGIKTLLEHRVSIVGSSGITDIEGQAFFFSNGLPNFLFLCSPIVNTFCIHICNYFNITGIFQAKMANIQTLGFEVGRKKIWCLKINWLIKKMLIDTENNH